MKQVNSKSYNINDDIVGRITFGKSIFSRSHDILVSVNAHKPALGYCATITSNQSIVNNGKPYCIVEDINSFQEGDVIIINNKGEIVFVYEISSKHNAIMATERCNHRCIMCPQPPTAREEDKTPLNLKLISLFDKNTEEVGITGGEPTLIGDNLFVLINNTTSYLSIWIFRT